MVSVADAIERLDALAATPPLARLATAFAAAGRELALVGGSVRDAFLGRPLTDLDLTTDARPDETLALVGPLATTTWEIGREFGTIGALVADQRVEITTYRADAYDGATRKPVVAFGDELEGDLRRRDFGVNAMALRLPDPAAGAGRPVLVDPGGGLDGLLAGVLDTPGDPAVSFGDDPLRMLRAARFVAQLGFRVADRVEAAMRAMAPSLGIVSAERIADELAKLLRADDPVPGVRLMVDTGIAEIVLPEVPALRFEADEHAHHKDVYEHTLTVLRQAVDLEAARGLPGAPDLVLRLAALLHDVGKPATKRVEGRVVSFHHHDAVGAKLATKRLRALRFDNDTVASVSRLVELHLRFFGYSDQGWTDAAVRRYVRDAGDELERLHILTRADVTTRNRRKAERLEFAYDDLERRIAELREREELDAVRPDLDGRDIMRILGLPPGREVGEAYRFLLDLRLDEGPLAPEDAERRLRAWWASRS
ncbi:MAG: CCA tRNA nucleotidyltransferase [Micrococcales bacterium 73-13]|nr:MAG: CCA tRNA nucleotidyltransferase [Micrococcales bacterium 73-13]